MHRPVLPPRRQPPDLLRAALYERQRPAAVGAPSQPEPALRDPTVLILPRPAGAWPVRLSPSESADATAPWAPEIDLAECSPADRDKTGALTWCRGSTAVSAGTLFLPGDGASGGYGWSGETPAPRLAPLRLNMLLSPQQPTVGMNLSMVGPPPRGQLSSSSV